MDLLPFGDGFPKVGHAVLSAGQIQLGARSPVCYRLPMKETLMGQPAHSMDNVMTGSEQGLLPGIANGLLLSSAIWIAVCYLVFWI